MAIAEQAQHLRELRDGYGSIEPELLLEAMMASQTRIVELETINAGDRHFPPDRRQWAREAIAWASADRELIQHPQAAVLSALR